MEDIISMSPFSIKLLIIGLAILGILFSAYYRIDGFDSDPISGTKGCDSTCSGFGFSRISGKPCCHDAVGQPYPKSQSDCPNKTTFVEGNVESNNQCLICIEQRNGTTKCHRPGSYDTNTFKSGTINSETSKTDVLTSSTLPSYLTELNALRKLEAEIHKGRDASGRELYSRNFSYLDDDDGIITAKASDLGRSSSETNASGANGRTGVKSGSWSNNNYWTNGTSGSKGGAWRDSDERTGGNWDRSDSAFYRKSLDELLEEQAKESKQIPGVDDEETPDAQIHNRSVERPSEKPYNDGARKGYDSCHKYMCCDEEEEEEEVCEGFSPLL